MAAVRVRQAAYRLASTLASSASAGNRAAATSAGGLLASRTRLAATAGPEAGCVAACEALKERAPQRPPGGGGEAGGALPVWAAMLEGWRSAPLGHATTPLLAENGYHEVLRQLGPEGLRPLPAGEVRVHWVLPNGSADESEKLMFEAPFRQAVEDSVQAVGKALRQEAESTDSGKRELKHGVHVIVVPREARPARLTACDAAIIPASTLRACLAPNPGGKHRDYPAAVAALQYVLAHEIAHIYLDHAEEWQLFAGMLAGARPQEGVVAQTPGLSSLAQWLDSTPEVNRCGAEAFLQLASFHKELSWKQDYEADELACALLARLRLTPDHMAAGMKALAAARANWHKQQLGWLLERWVLPSEEAKRLVEAKLGFPGDGLDTVLRRYEDTVKRGDVDAMDELAASFEASRTRHRLLELSEGSVSRGGAADPSRPPSVAVGDTPVPTAMVTGRTACPEYAVRTVLADIGDTHPPYSARLERIRQLSGQLPMLLRAVTPSMAVGGRYGHGSVAEQVAARLAEGIRAETAAKEAAAAKERAAWMKGVASASKWMFASFVCGVIFGPSPPPVA